jgi:hypothetical protein
VCKCCGGLRLGLGPGEGEILAVDSLVELAGRVAPRFSRSCGRVGWESVGGRGMGE